MLLDVGAPCPGGAEEQVPVGAGQRRLRASSVSALVWYDRVMTGQTSCGHRVVAAFRRRCCSKRSQILGGHSLRAIRPSPSSRRDPVAADQKPERFGEVASEPEYVWSRGQRCPSPSRPRARPGRDHATPEIVAKYGAPPGGARSHAPGRPSQHRRPRAPRMSAQPRCPAAPKPCVAGTKMARPTRGPKRACRLRDTGADRLDDGRDGMRTGTLLSVPGATRSRSSNPGDRAKCSASSTGVATGALTEVGEAPVGDVQTVARRANPIKDRVVPKVARVPRHTSSGLKETLAGSRRRARARRGRDSPGARPSGGADPGDAATSRAPAASGLRPRLLAAGASGRLPGTRSVRLACVVECSTPRRSSTTTSSTSAPGARAALGQRAVG